MRKPLVTALKLLVLVGLFAWIIANIQWRDSIQRTAADESIVERVEGRIVGAWDRAVVHLAVGEETQEFKIGPIQGGGHIAVAPGLLTYFRQLDLTWFVLGALGYVASMAAASARWWWLLARNGIHVRMRSALRLTWIGVFFNNFVPGQTGGDLVKAVYIVRQSPGRRVAAAMSVVVDRVLGLGSLALLGAVVVLFDVDRFGWLALGIWAVLLAVCAIGVFAFSRRLRRALGLDALLRRLPEKFAAALMKVDAAVFFYRDHKAGIFVWVVLGALNHVITVASFFCMGEALRIGVPPLEYFVLVPIALIGSAVPIAPNGWGVGEALFGKLFGTYAAVHVGPGVPDPEAVMRTRGIALSVLYRLHTTLWSLVGGVMLLADRHRLTRAELDAARDEGPPEVAR
ncbi:MAG: flippase-like domain-containing protein [Planctomycetes bacterium]|nr:flippase-like domain-containing protein [Planctomycetota bacterium]